MRVLENLHPKNVFGFFEDICSIPHGSGHTKIISDYIVNFAKERNLEYYQDNLNNVVIYKNASIGYEDAKTIILQGHTDMVCEKSPESDIDFEKDGLMLEIDGDFVKAKGTTLGGDDGIAVAYSLAILDDDTLLHPNLCAVFTVDEETGMFGADGIDVSKIKGNIMLNMDSEEEGVFLTSCAGGCRVYGKLPVNKVSADLIKATVSVNGLIGGHSGTQINKNRVNANILLGKMLSKFENKYNIINICGGNKDNVIPNSAKIELACENRKEFIADYNSVCQNLINEYKIYEPDMNFDVSFEKYTGEVLDNKSTETICNILIEVPNGVICMSDTIDGLVETSTNLGVVRLNSNFEMDFCLRSNNTSKKNRLAEDIKKVIEKFGGSYEKDGDYPEWKYKKESSLINCIKNSYYDLFGIDAKTAALHAGLECGIFACKIDDFDCVSFGPDIYDIHTVNERLCISSVERVYRLIVEVLKRSKSL